MKWIMEAFLYFADKYGLDTAIIILLLFGGWKLFYNHLHHLIEKIDLFGKKFSRLERKMDNRFNKLHKKLAVHIAVCNERHAQKK